MSIGNVNSLTRNVHFEQAPIPSRLGRADASIALLSLLVHFLAQEKGTKEQGGYPLKPQSVLFSGAEKRTKRDIHLTQALPYMEGM